MIPHIEGALWILGKRYDISDQNVNVHFPQTFGIKNEDNGIRVYFTRKPYSGVSWNYMYIDIYEDDVKLDYFFSSYFNLKDYTEYSFLFPFTTKGKKYTFKFKDGADGDVINEKSIIAEYTSNLKIDNEKLQNNFMTTELNYWEEDTEDAFVRKVNVIDPKSFDVFTGGTENNLPVVSIYMDIFAEEKSWVGTLNLSSTDTSGVNIFDDSKAKLYPWTESSLNDSGTILFKMLLTFATEKNNQAAGIFVINSPTSQTFTWTPTASE